MSDNQIPVSPVVGAVKANGQANGKAIPVREKVILNGHSMAEYNALKAQVEKLTKERDAALAAKPQPGQLVIRINDETKIVKDADGEEREVTGKGTICVYGNGRFPMAFYAEQWERLLAGVDKATLKQGCPVDQIFKLCLDPRATRKQR